VARARARASVSAREERWEDQSVPPASNAFISGERGRARFARGASSSARICKEHPRFPDRRRHRPSSRHRARAGTLGVFRRRTLGKRLGAVSAGYV